MNGRVIYGGAVIIIWGGTHSAALVRNEIQEDRGGYEQEKPEAAAISEIQPPKASSAIRQPRDE